MVTVAAGITALRTDDARARYTVKRAKEVNILLEVFGQTSLVYMDDVGIL